MTKYIGCYVKRFYTPFEKQYIFKIADYRVKSGVEEYLYDSDRFQVWCDIEDSVIITNELPVIEKDKIANVNSKQYKGYNPYTDGLH